MWVNPWPISQISSSWRRTLRWLREPARTLRRREPVLDDPAERARLEPLRPSALHQAPPRAFAPVLARDLCRVDALHHVQQARRVDHGSDVVHAHHTRAVIEGPHRARQRGVVARGGRRHLAPGRRREHRAEERLARGTNQHRYADACHELGRAARAARGCGRPASRSRCPGRPQRVVGSGRPPRAASRRATSKAKTSSTTSS